MDLMECVVSITFFLYFQQYEVSVQKIDVLFVFTSNYLCVHSFHPSEPLIIEHHDQQAAR